MNAITMRRTTRWWPALVLGVAVWGGAACSGVERYVWYDDIEPSANGTAFHIEEGDLLLVSVWNQEGMSGEARVRSDGFISVPLVGEVKVEGLTPAAAARAVAQEAESMVLEPRVVIQVVEAEPLRVGVLGRVARPGMYELNRGSSVLQALALAGGLDEFADRRRIFVIRDDKPVRFTFDDLVEGRDRSAGFALRSSDTVLVE